MKEVYGNIWSLKDQYTYIGVTTNSYVSKTGHAVMGRGLAYQVKTKYPTAPITLGAKLRVHGNIVQKISNDLNLVAFPVKEQDYMGMAIPKRIIESAKELMRFLKPHETIILPRPGCGNGGLTWDKVKPLIEDILDDRVTIVTYSKSNDNNISLSQVIALFESNTDSNKEEAVSASSKYKLTQGGLEVLIEEIELLKTVKRTENLLALKEAREQGDLSENADYDAARTEQARIEGRIADIEKIFKDVSIITASSSNKVELGSTVKILLNNEERVITILTSLEANPRRNIISDVSPLGKVLIGAKVDQTLTYKVGKTIHNVVLKEIL